MSGPGEQEQERVAAELQEAAAGSVRDLEQRLEAGADRVGDLLGADLAVAGEPLGHLGEPGDVDEEERPVDDLLGLLGGEERPVDGQAGDVGEQRLVGVLRATVCDRICCVHCRSIRRASPESPPKAYRAVIAVPTVDSGLQLTVSTSR